MRRFLPVVLLTLVVAACSDGSVNVEPEEDFQPDLSLAPANSNFFFLPPLAPEPDEGIGEFNPNLLLAVQVCLLASGECGQIVTTITAKLSLEDSNYHANWKTSKSDADTDFRISAVFLTGMETVILGSVDVHLRGNGKGGDPKAGSNIPVKFFAGVGLFSSCTADCTETTVPNETGGQVVVTDPDGDVVTVVDLPPEYSPDGEDRIVSVECNALGVTTPGTGPLPTVLRQWPLFCDYTLTPPLEPGDEFLEDVLVAVCQVDDAIPGQTDFHGFIRSELLLAKSDGPTDFQIPPQAPGGVVDTNLGNCLGAETPIALGGPNGFWGKLRSLGRTAMRAVGPRPLHAASMFYFGDGGIGALVRSFSLFGSVELFADSFEDDFFSWDQDGFWHTSPLLGIQNDAFTGGLVSLAPGDASDGFLPAPGAFDFSRWFGEDGSGNYMGEQANSNSGGWSTGVRAGTMSTPEFRMPNIDEDAKLQFLSWFEIESVNPSSFDQMDISVEDVDAAITTSMGVLNPGTDPDPNGSPNQPFTSGGFNLPPVWASICIDMNAFRTKNVRIHFNFDTEDTLYNGFRGWIVDAVQITRGSCPSMAPSIAETSTRGGLRPKGPPGTRGEGN